LLADDWIPASCSLPTVDQPWRRREFDEFFAEDVVSVRRTSPLEVHFGLRAAPEVAGRAANLASQETACCSFFRFDPTMTASQVGMAVTTEPLHAAVLAALTARAQARMRARA
jgi:hypothetical protein